MLKYLSGALNKYYRYINFTFPNLIHYIVKQSTYMHLPLEFFFPLFDLFCAIYIGLALELMAIHTNHSLAA